jgi:hypothetical protein
LTEQLVNVDAACRALKDRQQRGQQRAAAGAAKRTGNGVAERAEINILYRAAGRIAADRTRNKLDDKIDKRRRHDFLRSC